MMVRLAPRVFLHPPGERPPDLPAGAVALVQIPSAAFGDGSHPTTRLCARAVDYFGRRGPPQAVLDVGTGTGVLARLAWAHGTPFVVGTDIDPTALAAARINARLDARGDRIVFEGRLPDTWGPRFDLVVANILEPVLLTLADALVAALAPDGRLLLSGFLSPQVPALRVVFEARGLTFEAQAAEEGWELLQLRRRRTAAKRG